MFHNKNFHDAIYKKSMLILAMKSGLIEHASNVGLFFHVTITKSKGQSNPSFL